MKPIESPVIVRCVQLWIGKRGTLIPQGSKNRGFTLAEVLITTAIIAIMAAIAPTTLSGLVLTYKTNSAANQLATELLLARSKAISNNNNTIVTFSHGSYKYEIHSDDNTNGVRDAGEQIKPVFLPTGIQFGTNPGINGVDNNSINSNGINLGPDNAISFDDRGYASETGALYLIPSRDLSSPTRNDRMRAISILQATGQVKGWKYKAGATNPGPWEE